MLRFGLAMVICVLAACDGGDRDSTAPLPQDVAQTACTQQCEHELECEPTGDSLEVCTSECVQAATSWMRGDAALELIACKSMAFCGGSGGRRCVDEIEPLAVHTLYWEACYARMVQCNRPGDELDLCDFRGELNLLTPALVLALDACLDVYCPMIVEPCMTGVLADFGFAG